MSVCTLLPFCSSAQGQKPRSRIEQIQGYSGAAVFDRVFTRSSAAVFDHDLHSLGIASHWPFEDWGRFLPDHSTAVSLLDRLLHHNVLVVTEGESFRMKEAREGRKT
jgi:hypothetical protein